ncbi:hypothetical protein EBU94_06860, partial [bacterium]|nr:hypothetical protein [bacterium]
SKYLDLYMRFRNAELQKVVPEEKLLYALQESSQIFKLEEPKTLEENKQSILKAIRNYTNSVGTLAYRNPSLYELDEKSKMP